MLQCSLVALSACLVREALFGAVTFKLGNVIHSNMFEVFFFHLVLFIQMVALTEERKGRYGSAFMVLRSQR